MWGWGLGVDVVLTHPNPPQKHWILELEQGFPKSSGS